MSEGLFKIGLSHVAVLVPSVRKSADYLRQFKFAIGEEEIWDGEGTKEIYVAAGSANALLLMEPIKEGAYQRALQKRGPGIHHFAIDVLDLESFILSLSGSGWLLHPMSVKTMKKTQTAYLARPGFPGLIEVQERDEIANRPVFVENVTLSFASNLQYLLTPVGLSNVVSHDEAKSFLILSGQHVGLNELLALGG
jgi:hypothetical protein